MEEVVIKELLEMRRLALVLFLTAATYAELTSSELTKHACAIFNDCTNCRVIKVLKEQSEVLKKVKSGITVLPATMRPHAVQAFQQWTNHILEIPTADCKLVCEKTNLHAAACQALSAVAEHANMHTDTFEIVSKHLCKDDKSCLEKEFGNNQLVMTIVKDFLHFLASMVDPQNTCGIEAPIKRDHGISLYTNKEFLNCQLCYSLLQFINTAFVGGTTETSKTVLNAYLVAIHGQRIFWRLLYEQKESVQSRSPGVLIKKSHPIDDLDPLAELAIRPSAIGKAGEEVCKILDLPALLHLLVPGLGQLKCEDMPPVIVLAFELVIAPLFGAKAKQTCTRFYPYCSDVFDL